MVVGGIVAALVLFTILKKLIKMMFVFIIILIFGLAVLFLMYQNNPSMFSTPNVTSETDHNKQTSSPLSSEDQQQILEATQEIRQKAAEEVNKAVQEAQEIMQEGIEKRRPRPSQEEASEDAQK